MKPVTLVVDPEQVRRCDLTREVLRECFSDGLTVAIHVRIEVGRKK